MEKSPVFVKATRVLLLFVQCARQVKDIPQFGTLLSIGRLII